MKRTCHSSFQTEYDLCQEFKSCSHCFHAGLPTTKRCGKTRNKDHLTWKQLLDLFVYFLCPARVPFEQTVPPTQLMNLLACSLRTPTELLSWPVRSNCSLGSGRLFCCVVLLFVSRFRLLVFSGLLTKNLSETVILFCYTLR